MRYITLDEALVTHRMILDESGGAAGLRDLPSLQSALLQPLMTFGGQELYPELAEKAAALCFSIVINHPFVDGNKRVGHSVMETFLVLNGHHLSAPIAEQEQLILQMAAGEIARHDFVNWVRSHVVPRRREFGLGSGSG